MMKLSEAIQKAVDFYQSNGLTVIYRQAGVSPRLVAYDKKTDQVILAMVRRPSSKSYYTRQKGCRNAIGALVAWGDGWFWNPSRSTSRARWIVSFTARCKKGTVK